MEISNLKKIIYVVLFALGMIFLVLSQTTPVSIEKTIQDLGLAKVSPEKLSEVNSKGVFINFPNKSIFYNLDKIGVSFDENRERKLDEENFKEFKIFLEKELLYLTKYPVIDLENFTFYGLGENSQVSLNQEKFLEQISWDKVNSQEEIRIKPHFDEIFLSEENKKANEILVKKISSLPLQIKAGRKVFDLKADSLKEFLTYSAENPENKEIISFNQEKIIQFLSELNTKNPFPTEVDYREASSAISRALLFRLTEEKPGKTLVLPITGTYSKDPNLHPKFIEVNKSQQRAYLFENGKLYQKLVISTGLTWETPTGVFKVLRKVPMTISYTNNWYMPWYLPIGTMMGNYYFGFHEVPYQVNYNGLIYSRDPETIGSPATGGCIQVLKGQAEKVYNWADVGIPVYITD